MLYRFIICRICTSAYVLLEFEFNTDIIKKYMTYLTAQKMFHYTCLGNKHTSELFYLDYCLKN
jgi:hypothetical protein